jgi:hypothetical protein
MREAGVRAEAVLNLVITQAERIAHDVGSSDVLKIMRALEYRPFGLTE